MGLHTLRKSGTAVSEVMGNILLISIVCILFTVVAVSVISFLSPLSTNYVNILCEANGNHIILTHVGGDALGLDTRIGFILPNGSRNFIIARNYLNASETLDGQWSIGEKIVYSFVDVLANPIQVVVIDEAKNSVVFSTTVPFINSN